MLDVVCAVRCHNLPTPRWLRAVMAIASLLDIMCSMRLYSILPWMPASRHLMHSGTPMVAEIFAGAIPRIISPLKRGNDEVWLWTGSCRAQLCGILVDGDGGRGPLSRQPCAGRKTQCYTDIAGDANFRRPPEPASRVAQ